MAKTYYIGIDGGGTKTKFDLFDSDKNSIASITMPTIHPAQTSFKEAVSVLTDTKEKLLEKINDSDYILKVGAGLGGYGINADYRKKLEDEFGTVFDEFKLCSDAYAALLGALAGEDGILMIAGTGSIDRDGNVGDIGGIDKKVVAAAKEGASIFFAPDNPVSEETKKTNPEAKTNYETAVEAAKTIKTDMKIVPVKTLQDAIDYLKNN